MMGSLLSLLRIAPQLFANNYSLKNDLFTLAEQRWIAKPDSEDCSPTKEDDTNRACELRYLRWKSPEPGQTHSSGQEVFGLCFTFKDGRTVIIEGKRTNDNLLKSDYKRISKPPANYVRYDVQAARQSTLSWWHRRLAALHKSFKTSRKKLLEVHSSIPKLKVKKFDNEMVTLVVLSMVHKKVEPTHDLAVFEDNLTYRTLATDCKCAAVRVLTSLTSMFAMILISFVLLPLSALRALDERHHGWIVLGRTRDFLDEIILPREERWVTKISSSIENRIATLADTVQHYIALVPKYGHLARHASTIFRFGGEEMIQKHLEANNLSSPPAFVLRVADKVLQGVAMLELVLLILLLIPVYAEGMLHLAALHVFTPCFQVHGLAAFAIAGMALGLGSVAFVFLPVWCAGLLAPLICFLLLSWSVQWHTTTPKPIPGISATIPSPDQELPMSTAASEAQDGSASKDNPQEAKTSFIATLKTQAPRILDTLKKDPNLVCSFIKQHRGKWVKFDLGSEWSDNYAFPSLEELQNVSKKAYDTSADDDMGNWKLLMTAKISLELLLGKLESFFARVYFNEVKWQLLVAIKGTDIFNPTDLIADLENVFLNKGGLQVDSVFTFGEELRKLIAGFKTKPQVIITGHSLGGFLAQVLTFTLRNCGIDAEGRVVEMVREDFGLNTYVFDSPAASEQIKRIAKKDPLDVSCFNLPITNFVIKQNWINDNSWMGPHVGTVISLSAEEDFKVSSKWKISNISEKHGLKNFESPNLEEASEVIHLGSAELVKYDSRKIPLAQFSQLEQNALRDYQLLIQFPNELKNRLPNFKLLEHQVCVDRVEDAVKFIPRVRSFVQHNRKIIEDLDEKFQLQFFSAMSDLWKAHFEEFRDVDLKLDQERVDQILSMESGSSITGPEDAREQILFAKILSNSAEKFHFVEFDDFKRQDVKNIENWLLNYSGTLMLCHANGRKIELKDEYKTKILYLNSVKKDEHQTPSDISIKVSDLEEESRKRLRARKLDFRGNVVEAEKIFHTLFDALRVIEIIDFKCEQEKVEDEFYFEPKLRFHQYGKWHMDNELSTSSERAKKIQESNSQTFLMSCDAGMGKTTNLKKISRELQKSLPTHWVVRLELQSCSESLQRLKSTLSTCTQGSNTESALETNDQKKSFDAAISLVADEILKGVEESKAKLLREVFYEKIKQKEVIFVLDAVDEVCPLYQKVVLELLRQLKETGLKILVATRPLHETDIFKVLGTKREDILRLSLIDDKYNQAEFISQLWSSTSNVITLYTAKVLLRELEKTLPDMVPGVPLNLKMIAQSFPGGTLTKEFLNHKDLYKLLFDRGIGGTTQEKFGLNESNSIQQNIIESNQTKHYTLLQRVAVEAWFDGKNTFEYLTEEKVDFDRFNFAFVDEGNVRFTHQTFQEYLIAVQLVHFLNGKKDPKIKVFMNRQQSKRVLKDENCGKILAFADTILSHTNSFELVSSMTEFFDEKFAVDCLKKNHFNIFRLCKVDDSFYNTPAGEEQKLPLEFILLSENPKKEFVELLLEKGARLTDLLKKHHYTHVLDALIQVGQNELIADKWSDFEPALGIFDYNPLVAAAKFENLDAARFFIEEKSMDANRACRTIRTCAKDFLHNRGYLTPLSAAIKNDDRKLVDFLIEKGARVDLNNFLEGRENCLEVLYDRIKLHATKDVNGATLLMRAAERGTPDCVRFLLEKEFNPYEKDSERQTCLHYIAKRKMYARSDDLAERCHIFFDLFENAKNILLFEAVKEGHEEMLSLLLKKNVDLQTVDGDGNTCLHVAAKINLPLIRVIEENIDKFDLKARNKFGQTPLHVAAGREGQLHFVEILLWKGADPNAKDAKGMSPLHHAAASGRGYKCRVLLEKEVEVDSRDNEGMTPLMIAAKNNNPEALEALLEEGADASLQDKKGWNSLHHAAANGRDECITILRRRNVPLASKTNEGKTAFQLAEENKFKLMADLLLRDEVREEEYSNAKKTLREAIKENRVDVFKIHLETGNKVGDEEFVEAAWCGHLELLELFLPFVESVDVKDWMGATALMRAAQKNHVECVQFLLVKGADPKEIDKKGKTSFYRADEVGALESFNLIFERVIVENRNLERMLHSAAQFGNLNMFLLALERGADLSVVDEEDNSCLHLAAKKKNPECLEYLLLNHLHLFDINARNKENKTPLHYAAWNGGVPHLQLLMQSGADAAARDEDGQTALHLAAEYGTVENCQFLLGHIPTSINSKDKVGRTPLMVAAASGEEGAPSVIKFLLQKGADPNLQNVWGWNCFKIAAYKGRLENVKVLRDRAPTEAETENNKK